MDHSVKVWLIRLLICVPVLCLVISLALWKHTQNESEARSVKLHDELEQINIAKRELKRDVEAETAKVRGAKRELKRDVKAESAKVRGELDNMQHEKRQLRLEVENAQSEKKLLRGDLEHLQEKKREIRTQLEADRVRFDEQSKQITDVKPASAREKRGVSQLGGAVYVRWGRTSCTGTDTDLVYKGVAGGGHYSHTGAAVNLLCLPKVPIWSSPVNLGGPLTFIYGTEYEVHSVTPKDFPFGHANAPALHDHNVPCAVCRALTRSSVIMIPARDNCTGSDWQLEYHGFIMAGHYTHHAATEYNCVDGNPEADVAGYRDDNTRFLYRVHAQCGSLQCPAYEESRPLTCAVCTK